ncbi:uncharacterized protein Z518_07186 [Rhinocladiella mackenziei CBS 650.93]|uniref:Peptidase A2 domain-containing protein n=1 Tax=Rhinocladiella mackenziei CBS 650.93 TaxID=1442369 RepID=A0A0D2GZL2_9EURO|nr:uncharacterized protein Z518_07186 [Rhinocladiella mackenziei CBS 650.93]KIX03633.1 hypothetical protein Z518_07186 [Rhinocladiella mackenziei CBS 650.93]
MFRPPSSGASTDLEVFSPLIGTGGEASKPSLIQAISSGTKKYKSKEIIQRTFPHNSPEVVRSQLPLILHGQSESAVVDTGAKENVMSEKLARKLNLTVHKLGEATHNFVNAIGQNIKAIGYAEIRCSLREEPSQFSDTRFWIFPKMAVPLVVGRKFLEQTKGLTKLRHCLQKIIPSKGLNLRDLHIELPRWRLSCRVGDSTVLANPDTGSDLDLISSSYVRQSGFRLRNLKSNRQYVQFADGSQKRLSGVGSVPFGLGFSAKE